MTLFRTMTWFRIVRRCTYAYWWLYGGQGGIAEFDRQIAVHVIEQRLREAAGQ